MYLGGLIRTTVRDSEPPFCERQTTTSCPTVVVPVGEQSPYIARPPHHYSFVWSATLRRTIRVELFSLVMPLNVAADLTVTASEILLVPLLTPDE